jgi:tetratricopeptide (TPR) repeat protein
MAWERWRTPELLAGAREVLGPLASTSVAAEARYVEGTLAEQSGDLGAAKKAYEESIRLDASVVGARNNLAWLLADAGNWQEALDYATEASRAAPRSPACLDTLAFALRKGGRYDEAVRTLKDAIRLDPCEPKWQLSLGEVLVETGRSDEIGAVLARVDELVGHGAETSPASKKRLDRLRAAVR